MVCLYTNMAALSNFVNPRSFLIFRSFARFNSTKASKLIYSNYGDPAEVVGIEHFSIEPPEQNKVDHGSLFLVDGILKSHNKYLPIIISGGSKNACVSN